MNRRIAGYDFARSLAVFGLVIANFSRGIEKTGFHSLHSFIDERATATFMMLAGIGVSLLTQSVRTTNGTHGIADSRKRLIKRAAFLIIVGICCNLIWCPDMLRFYGICIAIGALLLTVSNRWLWSLVFVFIAIWAVFVFFISGYKVVS